MGGKPEVTQELVLHNRRGEKVPVMVSSFALQDEEKALLGAAVIIRDLNLVKRLETERRHLVNMFAHDLKTPVVGMAGLIRRLLQGKTGPLSPEQTAYEAFRATFGRAVLLGLEILVAADLIRTIAVEPTLKNLAILALLVVIRTFLSWALEVEIEGRWPWNRTPGPPRVV